jgi:hypothetical protein
MSPSCDSRFEARLGVAAAHLETFFVALAGATYVALLAHYLASPAFSDHVEPAVGSIASALLRGQPPYHRLTGGASYELPYGPAVYAVAALGFLLMGKSVAALKLPGLAASLAACAFTFSILRRRASARCATGAWGVVILYLVYYGARAYWCRPEPFLLLGSALALWLTRTRKEAPLPLYALLVAWMVDQKITGLLYLLPTLTLVAARQGLAKTIATTFAGIFIAFSVFAIPPLDLRAYAELLAETTRHGLSGSELFLNTTAAAVLLGPVVVVHVFRRRGLPVAPQRARWHVPLAMLSVCVAVTCVIAAKPGAGRHHLVPFIPIVMDALVDGVDGIERERVGRIAARASTLAIRAILAGAVVALSFASAQSLSRQAPLARASALELRSLLAQYRRYDVQMGYGDSQSYASTYDRLLVAFEHPLRLDAASQMDMTAAGLSSMKLLGPMIAGGQPEIWILPAGAPFSVESFYGRRGAREAVFDEDFRATFAKRYELIQSGRFYRVYRAKGRE